MDNAVADLLVYKIKARMSRSAAAGGQHGVPEIAALVDIDAAEIESWGLFSTAISTLSRSRTAGMIPLLTLCSGTAVSGEGVRRI